MLYLLAVKCLLQFVGYLWVSGRLGQRVSGLILFPIAIFSGAEKWFLIFLVLFVFDDD